MPNPWRVSLCLCICKYILCNATVLYGSNRKGELVSQCGMEYTIFGICDWRLFYLHCHYYFGEITECVFLTDVTYNFRLTCISCVFKLREVKPFIVDDSSNSLLESFRIFIILLAKNDMLVQLEMQVEY